MKNLLLALILTGSTLASASNCKIRAWENVEKAYICKTKGQLLGAEMGLYWDNSSKKLNKAIKSGQCKKLRRATNSRIVMVESGRVLRVLIGKNVWFTQDRFCI